MAKTTSLTDYRKKALANADLRAEYDILEAEYSLACAIINARIQSGLTQRELAERMGTTQSVIARLESGQVLPSSRTLLRIAKATETIVNIQFVKAL